MQNVFTKIYRVSKFAIYPIQTWRIFHPAELVNDVMLYAIEFVKSHG
jgi:hypothetical protein